MMQKADHQGPISHKVVSHNEFERLAARNVRKDGGKPMIEKTIFIVKPIYIPVEVQSGSIVSSKSVSAAAQLDAGLLSGKKKLKAKKQVQKSIYMERPKPPNY